MKVLQFSLIIFLLYLPATVAAQQTAGEYQSGFSRDGNILSFKTSAANVRLEFCSPGMVRVRTSWSGEFEPDENYMVVKYDWPAVDLRTRENADHFLIETSQLVVKAYKSPFLIDISSADGKLLLSEKNLSAAGGAMKIHDTVRAVKALAPDDHFFGFGERMDFIDQRGKKVRLDVGRGQLRPHILGAYNILEANYSPVPFFMNPKGYGLFLHNSYATEWDLGYSVPDAYSFSAAGGELDYYFIYGPSFSSIIGQYTELTGRSPLMPKFAHGLHAGTYSGGTWGYEHLTSTRYVVNLAKKFRELGIPLDMLHLDSTWRIFGKNGGKGATSFEWRPTFDDPKAMLDSLYALGLNAVGLHIRPRFDNGEKLNLLDQAREKGYVYPENDNPGEFVNFFDQEAVDWWWENGVVRVAELGAMFLKTDEGSAFGAKANESDKTGPTGEEIRKLHNIFPIVYAKAPFEKFQEYNGLRGFNQTREGYAGIQRYPYIFAGDWPSEWQYFAPVIRAGLNIGLSGVGYWSHCMGGFEHDADPELYIRWVQFGMFSPVAHVFGMDHPGYKEPWNYGPEALEIFKQYHLLRYSLLPYIYSQCYKMYETGVPIMRALVFEYQEDENVYEIDDQYLFGDNILVCPVTTKGAQTRVVYLPEGTWYDYWTGQKHEGKKYLNALTPLDRMPMFVKAGAVIPTETPVQYIAGDPDTITLEVYPGSGSFTLYDDDGRSLEYQKGVFSKTLCTVEEKPSGMVVSIGAPDGKYKVSSRAYRIKALGDEPAEVRLQGKKMSKAPGAADFHSAGFASGWFYDQENRTTWVKLPPAGRKGVAVEIVKK